MTTTPCKGCGKPIIWAKTPSGATIPLDARATVYRLETENGVTKALPDGNHFVSHFVTCPERASFSGRNKSR